MKKSKIVSIALASFMLTSVLNFNVYAETDLSSVNDIETESDVKDRFCFEIENDENICGLEVGNELGLMLQGVSDDESVEYTLSDEKIGKIIYADNTQVTIQLLEAGETVLTAKSSKGNTASVTIIARPTITEPTPLEPDVKKEFRFNIGGDTVVSYVGLAEGVELLGVTDGETIEFKVSDEKIGKIIYADNTQVVIDLLEAGEIVITATSSNGSIATMNLIVEPIETEPIPLEPEIKNEIRFNIEGDTVVSYVGLAEGVELLGVTDGETIEYTISDEKIGKIIYADNTQVVIDLLEAGEIMITATSSKGNMAAMNLIVEPIETEPVSLEPVIKGDVNADGKFNVIDVLTFQKWLLDSNTELKNWKAADLCENGVLNVFDLCMMKKELISNND